MAATAPKMSARGELASDEAAPVFSGAPPVWVELPVDEPVGAVAEGVLELERVALCMVLFPLWLTETEAEAEVARLVGALVVEPDAEAEAEEAEADEADEAEADDAEAEGVAVLPDRAIGPM